MMNRRTFFKTTAVVITLPLVGCENKPCPRVEFKWISFKDQMPEHHDYIEVRDQQDVMEKAYVYQVKTLSTEPKRFVLWLKKDVDKGHCTLMDINKKLWQWRTIDENFRI